MAKFYRIILEEYETLPKAEIPSNILMEGEIESPTSCLDFGMRHEDQINLISKAQDKILHLQADKIV